MGWPRLLPVVLLLLCWSLCSSGGVQAFSAPTMSRSRALIGITSRMVSHRRRASLFSTAERNFASSEALDDDAVGVSSQVRASNTVAGSRTSNNKFEPVTAKVHHAGEIFSPRASALKQPTRFAPKSSYGVQEGGAAPRSSSQALFDEPGMMPYFPNEESLFETSQASRGSTGTEDPPQSTLVAPLSPSSKRLGPDALTIVPEVKTPDQYGSYDEYFNSNNIKSRPAEGGMWNVDDPLGWTKNFGRRSADYESNILKDLIHKKPGDEGYYDVSKLEVPGVAIVRTREQAQIVLERLNAADPSIFHACDTEVMDIDLSSVGPVGNGYVTCVSVYSGPDFDYGLGQGPGATLWIDNLDDACGILQEFKEWFENEKHLKVWHNYGFDRHVMFNEGIDVKGFGGDTMHMARLQDTSRAKGGGGYGLEALTADIVGRRKKPMKEIFGIRRERKDGTLGNLLTMPAVEEMQRNPKHRTKWIEYSCYDAKGTWLLREELHKRLLKASWIGDTNLWDYYWMHMREFGEVLTDMERRGIRVDTNYLGEVEKKARADRAEHVKAFRKWAEKQLGPDGLALNTASSVQLTTFLFGGSINPKMKEPSEKEKVFKVPRTDIPEDALEAYRLRDEKAAQEAGPEEENPIEVLKGMKVAQLQNFCREQGLKASGKRDDLLSRLKEHFCSSDSVSMAPEPVVVGQIPDIDKMKVSELKSLCRKHKLAVGIQKADWQAHIRRYYGAGITSMPEIGKMKVKELKSLCDEKQIKVDLEQTLKGRLRKYYEEHGGETSPSPPAPSGKKYEEMSESMLRGALSSLGRTPSGSKEDLVKQLREAMAEDDFETLTEDELRSALRARGAYAEGKSAEEMRLLLRQDIEMTRKIRVAKLSVNGIDALAQVLEKARKTGEGAFAEYLKEQEEKAAKIPKHVDVKITSLGLEPEKYTAGGAASVTADVLRKLAGDPFADPPNYGSAYERLGKEGCEALYSLCSVGSIDTMIANFITSLQELADEDFSRVHCSLNLNTDTGRLSSRQPNLQNQPALEKDVYKIRQSFESSPGNNLIVADYGQLELRILASLTDCKSMIDAFEAGGDFHSRTAMDMFDYVRKALDDGTCLLEWDYSQGDPPKPLLKDMFASERRKAKTLNFSIAYGKTAHGLSKDWGVTVKEADQMLKAWYDARPEVRNWQDRTKKTAVEKGITRTLMGRYRHLPSVRGPEGRKLLGSIERQSINTPVQGGAADIAMMAMNKINASPKLAALGWVLLLQVHDEVILEGPSETAEEAFEEVLQCMQEPWVFGLKKTSVPLLVDGSYTHHNWYEAK